MKMRMSDCPTVREAMAQIQGVNWKSLPRSSDN
jgi:hypothetical protein